MKHLFLIFIFISINYSFANEKIIDLKKKILKAYTSQNYPVAIQKSYELIDYSKEIENREELNFAYENIGVFYSDICDYKTSMKFYKKALSQLNIKNDEKKYYNIILNIATTLLEANNNIEAIYYYKKAKKYFTKNKKNNYAQLICCYTNLAIAYQNLNQLDLALENNRIAIKIAKDQFLLDQFSGSLINMGDIYFKLNDLKSALKFYDDAIFYLTKNNNNLGLWHSKMGKANVFSKQNKIQEAFLIYDSALVFFIKIKNVKDIIKCYNKLSKLSLTNLDYKKAYFYKNNELLYIDSLKNEENTNAISNIKIQLEISKTNQQIKIKNQLIDKEKKIANLLFFSVTLLIIIIIILYNTYKNRQKLLKSKNIETEKLAQIEKEILTKKLKISENELETFALHIIQKNEFIEHIKNEIKSLKKSNLTDNNSLISKLILKLNNTYKKNKELELFLKRVEEVNSNFYYILSNKYPDLTLKEKKLCALIKLNLSSKDIALLSNVSIGAVTMARYRLRTKINIEKDENLAEFLINLS